VTEKIKVKRHKGYWRVYVPELDPRRRVHPKDGYPFKNWRAAIRCAHRLIEIRRIIFNVTSDS
jgi:hypothetical protein